MVGIFWLTCRFVKGRQFNEERLRMNAPLRREHLPLRRQHRDVEPRPHNVQLVMPPSYESGIEAPPPYEISEPPPNYRESHKVNTKPVFITATSLAIIPHCTANSSSTADDISLYSSVSTPPSYEPT